MQSRFHPMFFVLIPLAALGILYQFDELLRSLLIPIVILLVLYAMYVLSPQGRTRGARYRGKNNQSRFRQPERLSPKPKAKRPPSPFRVIEGNRNNKDDETPRYH